MPDELMALNDAQWRSMRGAVPAFMRIKLLSQKCSNGDVAFFPRNWRVNVKIAV
ncbi:hypothetical protein QCE63_29965 [Caballeronia sp. LZ065]|uniref:hypothetical protein n=1 Tax=Caballeronia sp. LZ065 TaxID=3038571 RepID=UPI002859D846|nr:hypothetical protein [Caballeronia sp. LZ065]MDR5783644.1 hypothetical protein [Caballeronia sp. LZ065]